MHIAVIIPVLNEVEALPRLLDYLASVPGQEFFSITLVDGGSTDGSPDIAESRNIRCLPCERGRALQLNYGAAHTTEPILYFLHADVLPPRNFVADIQKEVSNGIQIGCYRFRFDSQKLMLRINSYFTRFDRMWCRGGDQSLFISRALFEKLGGFDTYYSIMEEYDLIRRARKTETFRIMTDEVVVSARKYSTNSWLRVQLANLNAFRMFRRGAHPDAIRKAYQDRLNPF